MNYWQYEMLAEERREEIRAEMKQIRLEEQALAARPVSPGWYGRRMFSLGNWMIATGRQLRGRYEIESRPTSHTHKVRGSFAR